jgi:hypothetical protein
VPRGIGYFSNLYGKCSRCLVLAQGLTVSVVTGSWRIAGVTATLELAAVFITLGHDTTRSRIDFIGAAALAKRFLVNPLVGVGVREQRSHAMPFLGMS